MAEAMPLVSVVTPVYNGAAFLPACIESVLAQSYPHWEYVILDNRSADASVQIAHTYAERDPRVRVVVADRHRPMLANWNAALRLIAPESVYCKVLHADDLLLPECLERMVVLAEAHPSVGIVGAYRLNGSMVDLDGLPYPSPLMQGRAVCRRVLLEHVHLFGTPSSTLIRADLIRQRPQFYNERNMHADTEACFDLLRSCDWGFVHQVLTFSRQHAEQNSSRARRLNSYLAGNVIVLLRYGRDYLAEDEYRLALGEVLQHYDRWLARNVLRRSGPEFWRFHREAARQIGYPLRVARLASALADLLADRLLRKLGLGWLYHYLGLARRQALGRRLADMQRDAHDD